MTTSASLLPTAANSPAPAGTTATSGVAASVAANYSTFLQMLTTQLKNQDPLSPVDTNQFTQELVQFSQVEQQLQTNSQLATLISLQQTAQSTAALGFVGKTVTFNSATAQMSNGQATWTLASSKPATASVIVRSSAGQTAFSGQLALNAGSNTFAWNGQGNDGTQWPDGAYTISVTATDASGQSTTVSTQASGVVSAVDLTKTPPVLSVGNQTFTLDKISGVT